MTYQTRASTHSSGLWFVAILMALAVGGGGLLMHQFLSYLDRPEVQFSYDTKECKAVIDHASIEAGRTSEWSCTNLPPSYEHVWVY